MVERLDELAVAQCVGELRAAARRPIDQAALETLIGWLRPQFVDILNHPEGARRWAEHGHLLRDNARHIGALADFFASHVSAPSIGIDELSPAFQMVRAACTVGADGPVPAPVDVDVDADGPAERLLRALSRPERAATFLD